MEQDNLKIVPRSISDFKNAAATKNWKCDHCKTLFVYPIGQTENLKCVFCKRDLLLCPPNDPLLKKSNEDEENKEKTFAIVKRDADDNIVDIIEVNEERYNLINEKVDSDKVEQPKITTVKINVALLSPFNLMESNLNNVFNIVVYKQNDFCAITNILKGIFDKAVAMIKEDEGIDENLFNIIYATKDDESYLEKDVNNYPQIAVFYGDKTFIEFIPMKELNENSLYSKLFYYYSLQKNKLI